jgi:uncharacterized membrane protein YbaN (DUF454 family)
MHKARRLAFTVLGLLFVVLAYIGILLPGVPAIPFVLLACWCFLRGAPRLLTWLARQRFIGPIVRRQMEGGASPVLARWIVISQLWVSIIVAQWLFVRGTAFLIAVNVLGVAISLLVWRLMGGFSRKETKEGQ